MLDQSLVATRRVLDRIHLAGENAFITRMVISSITLLAFGLMAYFYDAFFYTLLIGSSLYLAGFGAYFLVRPPELGRWSYSLVLMPLMGLAMFTLVGSVAFGVGLPVRSSIWVALCLIGVMDLAVFALRKEDVRAWKIKCKQHYLAIVSCLLVVVLPLLAALLYPVLYQDYSTTPYRIGPDVALYGKMAQYMLDGATWPSRFDFLDAPSFRAIYENNIFNLMVYSDATMTWPLMYLHRWGVSVAQAYYFLFTPAKQVFQTNFLAMVPTFLLMGGLVFLILCEFFHLRKRYAILGAVLLTLNVNIVNLWCEGFYAHVFTMPFVIAFLIFCLKLRHSELPQEAAALSQPKGTLRLFKMISPHMFLFGFIVFNCIFITFTEAIFWFIALLLGFVAVMDLIFRRRVRWRTWCAVLMICALTMLLLAPLGMWQQWFPFSIKSILTPNCAGYTQPRWATMLEIIGVDNIYQSDGADPRTLLNVVLNLAGTGLILVLVVYHNFVQKTRSFDLVFWNSSLGFVFFWMLTYPQINPTNNYGYMKFYTYTLPVLFPYIYATLAAPWRGGHLAARVAGGLAVLCFIPLIFFSFYTYARDYARESYRVTKSQMELHEIGHLLDPAQFIILPADTIKSDKPVTLFIIGATVPILWLEPTRFSEHQEYAPFHLTKRLAILTTRAHAAGFGGIYPKPFENDDYALLITDRHVSDGMMEIAPGGPLLFSVQKLLGQ